MKVFMLLTVLILINLFDRVRPEALSLSIAGMENLIWKEKALIDNLELYLQALERKSEVIRSNLFRMKAENDKAQQNVEEYLKNPLQAFSLMRRVYEDWVNWEIYLQKPVGDEYVKKIYDERATIPTQEEFEEAMDAMYRLQDTYGLDANDMAFGKLNKVQYGVRLSAIDSFSIGFYLHKQEIYLEASQWFHAALNLFQNDGTMNEVLDFSLSKILYFYAQNLAKQGFLDRAIHLLNSLLLQEPRNVNAHRQRHLWEMEMQATVNFPKPIPTRTLAPSNMKYYMGCRGEYKQRMPNLYCIYNTTTTDFLRLAPLKMEVVSLDPYMVLYHNAISDYEIQTLKILAKPKLTRATVYDHKNNAPTKVKSRTSKFAWFPDDTNAVTERVNRRLADMTGFDLYGSEQLQVMNYGLGGHYDTHYDFFNVSSDSQVVKFTGDRIATALFYLSDVEQGGATVFPNIELAVFPKKGSLILWYNLNSRGEGKPGTLHAACPVLVGSKWICNKWIRERAQLFRRPCLPE